MIQLCIFLTSKAFLINVQCSKSIWSSRCSVYFSRKPMFEYVKTNWPFKNNSMDKWISLSNIFSLRLYKVLMGRSVSLPLILKLLLLSICCRSSTVNPERSALVLVLRDGALHCLWSAKSEWGQDGDCCQCRFFNLPLASNCKTTVDRSLPFSDLFGWNGLASLLLPS